MILRYRDTLIAGAASLILGAACLAAVAPSAAGAQSLRKGDAAATKAPPGRPMTAAELRALYGGKTWVWSNGGGYMDPSGRFYAAVGQGRAGATYTQGTWQTANNGQMCFGGVWKAGARRHQGRTCFSHRTTGDVIYQRKEPSGSWYAFKHTPARSEDEFSKLVQGNRISDQMRQIQAALTP